MGAIAYDWKTAPDRHDCVWSIEPKFTCSGSKEDNHSYLYNLQDPDAYPPGLSIEINDRIREEIDTQNSDWQDKSVNDAEGRLTLSMAKSRSLFSAELGGAVKFQKKSLHYNKPEFAQNASRDYTLPSVGLSMRYNNSHLPDKKTMIYGWLSARYTTSAPNLIYQIDTRNTSDPLNIQNYNPNLKNTGQFNGTLQLGGYHRPSKISFNVYATGSFYRNRVVRDRKYDPATGVTEWTPLNMSGSHNWNCYLGLYKELGKGFNCNVGMQGTSQRSVETFNSPTWSGRNVITTRSYYPNVGISYNKGDKFNASLSIFDDITIGKSEQGSFADYRYEGYGFSCNLQYTFPWKMNIVSNYRARYRSGHEDPAMNSPELMWTMRISQPFLDDKLTLTLNVSNLLDGDRSIYAYSSAYALTETWQSTLPRYVMLTVGYRFNVHPKKK